MTTTDDSAPIRSTPQGEHVPVLMAAVLEALDPKPGETAIDCTLGYAGHAREIARRIAPGGLLVGLDWDADNLPRAHALLEAEVGSGFVTRHSNFAAVESIVAELAPAGVDVLLADLGMSSMQVDDPDRGFSFKRDGPLDMRMDRTRGRTAAELLAATGVAELADILRKWGDEPRAELIAEEIVSARRRTTMRRTSDLVRVIEEMDRPRRGDEEPPRRFGHDRTGLHPAARTFQALRIAVNRETSNLSNLLRVLPSILKPGGRAAFISFHSGEDRLVKEAFRLGVRAGDYSAVSDDPARADDAEQLANPRSRSAKLRWARRSTEPT